MEKRFIISTAMLLIGSIMGAIAQGDGSSGKVALPIRKRDSFNKTRQIGFGWTKTAIWNG